MRFYSPSAGGVLALATRGALFALGLAVSATVSDLAAAFTGLALAFFLAAALGFLGATASSPPDGTAALAADSFLGRPRGLVGTLSASEGPLESTATFGFLGARGFFAGALLLADVEELAAAGFCAAAWPAGCSDGERTGVDGAAATGVWFPLAVSGRDTFGVPVSAEP